jgi:hypothetical protein
MAAARLMRSSHPMRLHLALYVTPLVLLLTAGTQVAQGDEIPTLKQPTAPADKSSVKEPPARTDDTPALKQLAKIQPPGGPPLSLGKPGGRITVEALEKVCMRLDSSPQADLTKWVAELERITGKELDSDLERGACLTYFVRRMSVAFEGLQWNASAADRMLKRAQTMPPAEARAWKDALEAVLRNETERDYLVPLVLIPVNALHEGETYSAARGGKLRARLKQLTAADVALWKGRVDRFGGSELDAALNLVLLDDYFNQETFQRDRFKAAVGEK